ncbi:unnamed protein product [Prorocentrum cordatum]|uniref:ATP-dependent DNA helicase n=1 Tax=Prorocentrum cordatum TaxID=2364126 RepID=A0ABN9X4B9_9DINO|nr:unnamed protein product [Polarella glacialis]
MMRAGLQRDVRGDDGRRLGVAGSEQERARLDERAARDGEPIACACPGVHGDQLTPEMFFAVRHVEVAARLEYIAEARGLPTPARGPSDAVAEEELGGDRSDDDGVFGLDEALRGWQRKFDDVLHRTAAAQAAKSSRAGARKKALMGTFLQLQRRAYACVRQPCAVQERAHRLAAMTPADAQTARKNQDATREHRAAQDDNLEAAGADLPVAAAALSDAPASSRRLGHEDMPISPLQAALTLISESGVWKRKEQYLMTLFLLQPIQQLRQNALETDGLDSLSTAASLAAASRGAQVRRVFLHGPGGSGRTYCMTEVVNKVVVRFFRHRGLKLKLVAAANGAARILGGKTMRAAAKLTRKQSLADLLRLCAKRAIEEPCGQVPAQAIMGDFVQVNPVCSHALLEALLARARAPGAPRKITDEGEDGWKVFSKMASDVVVFTGTRRFLDEDLPLLFEVMRTPDRARVLGDLRAKIRDRVQRGPDDPRMSMDCELEGVRGFFALGARAGIQREQFARLQQLRVLASARAVGRFKHHQDRDMHLEALKFMNLSRSNGLPGMCAAYLGMRGRLTEKVMGPELVQEATGEVDYAGLGKRGAFHLEPVQDEWDLPVARVQTVNHPGAPRATQFVAKRKRQKGLQVARAQLSWAPENQLTFQGIQGRTIRGPEGQPGGFVVDLFRPGTMQGEDRQGGCFHHVWVILGRARKLEWVLLQNFPLDESAGDLDWSILEQEPPDYLIEFLGAAATLSKRTWRRMLRAQKELGAPSWEDVPECPLGPDRQGRFLHIAEDWIRAGAACARPVASASAEARPDAAPRRRLRGKRPREDLRSKTDQPTAPPDEPGGAPPRRKRSRGEGAGDEGERACALPGAAPAFSTHSTLPSAPAASAGGWHCSLLGHAIGRRRRAPAWFNNPLRGEVDPASGTQLGLACGFFAMNHCLGHAGAPQLSAEGAAHQEAIPAAGDSDSCLAVSNGILRQPCPRHWIVLVRPPEAVRDGDAAWLCDSSHSAVVALEAGEVQDLLGHAGCAQMGAADRAGSEVDRMREIADWRAYRVHR